jgi:hypothetical protein
MILRKKLVTGKEKKLAMDRWNGKGNWLDPKDSSYGNVTLLKTRP